MCRVGQACSVEEAEEDRALFEQVARGDADMDYSTCRWVTVTAMYTRLLEERVARLEARIVELEAFVASQRVVVNGNGRSYDLGDKRLSSPAELACSPSSGPYAGAVDG